MLEAITYRNMINELEKRYGSKNKTFGILLVKPNKSEVSEEIINNLNEYHHRSGHDVDIFVPGYGAYWPSEFLDSVDVCEFEHTTWSYSAKYFNNFIRDIREHSKMNYRGGSELILLDYNNSEIDYSKVVRVKLNAALRDGAIDSVDEFFEYVIDLFLGSETAYGISDKLTLNQLGTSISTELAEASILFRIFKRSKHYTIRSYKK